MTTTTLPKTQLGLLTTKDEHKFQTFPVPEPGPNEVLIRNVAVASNPKDWKVLHWIPGYSGVEGNDVAGYIVKVGEGVTEYKVGDRVAAFTIMASQAPKYGAYIEYSVALAPMTFPIPESTTFEEAATIPLAAMTAAIALFRGLSLPEVPTGETKGVIINGAASSVGAYCVQLAKLAGLFVIGVAGSSKEYAKSLGADIVIDYRDYQSAEALENALVAAASGHNVSHVFDAVVKEGTILLLARALSKIAPGGKGTLTYVLFLSDEDAKKLPPGITAIKTSVDSAYGKDLEFATRWYRKIGQLLAPSPNNHTPLQPNRVKLLPNGLASVPDGLKLLEEDKVHAEKLVYRIADTPQLKEGASL